MPQVRWRALRAARRAQRGGCVRETTRSVRNERRLPRARRAAPRRASRRFRARRAAVAQCHAARAANVLYTAAAAARRGRRLRASHPKAPQPQPTANRRPLFALRPARALTRRRSSLPCPRAVLGVRHPGDRLPGGGPHLRRLEQPERARHGADQGVVPAGPAGLRPAGPVPHRAGRHLRAADQGAQQRPPGHDRRRCASPLARVQSPCSAAPQVRRADSLCPLFFSPRAAGFAVQEEVDHITIWRGLVEEKVIPAAEANLFPY